MDLQAGVLAAIRYLVEKAPELAVVAIIALRLEQQMTQCIDHMEKVIDKLLDIRGD